MKNQLLRVLLLAQIVLLCLISLGSTMSISTFGDVQIILDGNTFKCDKIYCPENTYRCRVTKHKSPTDPAVLERKNYCFSNNGEILLQHSSNETINPGTNINLNLETNRNGVTSTFGSSYIYSSYNGSSKEIEENAEKINRRVNEEISKVNKQIDVGMENFRRQMQSLDYELGRLNENIGQSVREITSRFG